MTTDLEPEIIRRFDEDKWRCYEKKIKQHKDVTYWPAGTQRNEERHYDGEISDGEVTCPETYEDTPRTKDIYRSRKKECIRKTWYDQKGTVQWAD